MPMTKLWKIWILLQGISLNVKYKSNEKHEWGGCPSLKKIFNHENILVIRAAEPSREKRNFNNL